MGRAEMQASADTLGFQGFHQRVAGIAARRFIHANNEQMPGMQMRPGGNIQGHERCVGKLQQIAAGNLRTAAVGIAEFAELHQGQRGVNIREVVFKTGRDHFGLRCAAERLAVKRIDAETVELEAANTLRQLFVVRHH
ncbi:hypothetical protein D3C76_1427680 [compost metagenome]